VASCVLTLAVSVGCVSPAAAELIHRHDWSRVTSAISVLQLPALQRVIDRYESGEDMVIVIRYPGGDDGNAWAIELRDWLVSFGISSKKIELQPGSGAPGAIAIDAEPHLGY
jgi:type IV pilus biogenesis protein CpaD/CtpE